MAGKTRKIPKQTVSVKRLELPIGTRKGHLLPIAAVVILRGCLDFENAGSFRSQNPKPKMVLDETGFHIFGKWKADRSRRKGKNGPGVGSKSKGV